MQDDRKNLDDRLDIVIRDALDLEIDEAAISKNIRVALSREPKIVGAVRILQRLAIRSPVAASMCCLGLAFIIGFVSPQPNVSISSDTWINLALGDISISSQFQFNPTSAATETH